MLARRIAKKNDSQTPVLRGNLRSRGLLDGLRANDLYVEPSNDAIRLTKTSAIADYSVTFRSFFHHLFIIFVFLLDFGCGPSVFDDFVPRTTAANGCDRKD